MENIDIKLDDEDQSLLLLKSLPSEFENLADTLLYGRDSLTLDEVQATLSSKELKKKSTGMEDIKAQGLNVRERSIKRDFKSKPQIKSKSREKWKCFVCKKDWHFKKDCPERKKRPFERQKENEDVDVASER